MYFGLFLQATFLVYTDEDFAVQFSESVVVLKLLSILQLFIKLDGIRSGLAADTIAILCHIIRTIPKKYKSISIVETVLLGKLYTKNASDARNGNNFTKFI